MKFDAVTRHKIAGVVWVLLIIPTILWWKNSILWVACMSLYANIENSFGASHAADQKCSQCKGEL